MFKTALTNFILNKARYFPPCELNETKEEQH